MHEEKPRSKFLDIIFTQSVEIDAGRVLQTSTETPVELNSFKNVSNGGVIPVTLQLNLTANRYLTIPN